MWQSARYSLQVLRLAYNFSRHGASYSLKRVGVPGWVCAIFSLAAKNNLPKREGERLRQALESMGPTFMKLGQALSTRPDLLGEEVAADLATLQDRIPPFPTDKARRVIEEEHATGIESLFREFADTPVAAASIAQVHFAVTTDGREVAVKVLRPGIHEAFAKDIALFYWLARMTEKRMPELRRLKPVAVVRTFEESIQRELDLRMEAAAADTLRENTRNDGDLYIPAVDWNLTSESVLTLERIHGIPISHVEELKTAGHNMDMLIQKAASTLFNQVFRDGFFHADLHPGNLFVGQDGKLIAVDFGITGRIDQRSRLFVAEILRGFLQEDYHHVAQMHIDAGYVPSHHAVEDFALACMAIGKPILGKPLQEISVGQLLGQLFKVSALFDMETQPQLLLLQKNMILAEGVGRMLDPNVNMWQLCKPLIEDWARSHLSPQGRLKLAAGEILQSARRLPEMTRRLKYVLAAFDEQGIKLHPQILRSLYRNPPHLTIHWHSLLWFAAGLVVAITAAFWQ